MFGVCDTTVQVSDLKNNLFHVYPNPTNDLIYVETPFNDNFQINILTTQGTLVQHLQRANTTRTTLSLSGLPKGMYFIQIKNDNEPGVIEAVII